jgi:hypothetical protein
MTRIHTLITLLHTLITLIHTLIILRLLHSSLLYTHPLPPLQHSSPPRWICSKCGTLNGVLDTTRSTLAWDP